MPEALYLYGTDFMSTEDIATHYMGARFSEIKVSWINDSSCKLTFPDDATA